MTVKPEAQSCPVTQTQYQFTIVTIIQSDG